MTQIQVDALRDEVDEIRRERVNGPALERDLAQLSTKVKDVAVSLDKIKDDVVKLRVEEGIQKGKMHWINVIIAAVISAAIGLVFFFIKK